MSDHKWMSTGYLQAAPRGKIDHENGIIEGVSVTTEGEAKGHGVSLDESFVDTVIEFGNARKQGLKSRFGHPNMSSTALGTFLGRLKNFRKETITRDDGSKANRAIADMFVSNEAKETPHGNLYDYVMGMAQNEPDVFGTSIVFTPGRRYRKTSKGQNVYREWQKGPDGECLRNTAGDKAFRWVDDEGKEVDPAKTDIIERDYIECAALHACDAVDDPAANDGLFSRFSRETVAGQITEFLDLHPQVWTAIQNNPSIVEALARYGDKVDGFIERYREYRKQNGENIMTEETTSSEQLEKEKGAPSETPETPETPKEQPPAAETANETPDTPKGHETDPAPATELSRDEFLRIVDEFGAEIAAKIVKDGGNYEAALKLAYEAQKTENAKLQEQIGKLSASKTGRPAPVNAAANEDKKPLFNTGK